MEDFAVWKLIAHIKIPEKKKLAPKYGAFILNINKLEQLAQLCLVKTCNWDEQLFLYPVELVSLQSMTLESLSNSEQKNTHGDYRDDTGYTVSTMFHSKNIKSRVLHQVLQYTLAEELFLFHMCVCVCVCVCVSRYKHVKKKTP